MARSTCDPDVDAPKGMLKFEVIRTTIKDSLGQYCAPGDMAVLEKKTAKWYLDQNLIKVALPEFDVDDADNDGGASDDEGGGEDEGERGETPLAARKRASKRRARTASN